MLAIVCAKEEGLLAKELLGASVVKGNAYPNTPVITIQLAVRMPDGIRTHLHQDICVNRGQMRIGFCLKDLPITIARWPP